MKNRFFIFFFSYALAVVGQKIPIPKNYSIIDSVYGDLNKDGIGDVPYHPLSLFAVLTESTPSAMLLYRSFMITLLDKSEKILPSITPDNFIDKTPLMKSMPL